MTSNKNARISVPAAVVAAFLGSFGGSMALANEPAVIKPVAPEYPRAAERREIEGNVVVSIDVGADGSVTNVAIVESVPAGIFDSSAINAVKRWKFESGKPATGVKKAIRFKLEG
jgi:protein TonB